MKRDYNVSDRRAKQFIALSLITCLYILFILAANPSSLSIAIIYIYTLFLCYKSWRHDNINPDHKSDLRFCVYIVISLWRLGAIVFGVETLFNYLGTLS